MVFLCKYGQTKNDTSWGIFKCSYLSTCPYFILSTKIITVFLCKIIKIGFLSLCQLRVFMVNFTFYFSLFSYDITYCLHLSKDIFHLSFFVGVTIKASDLGTKGGNIFHSFSSISCKGSSDRVSCSIPCGRSVLFSRGSICYCISW